MATAARRQTVVVCCSVVAALVLYVFGAIGFSGKFAVSTQGAEKLKYKAPEMKGRERREFRETVFEAETKGVPVKVNAAYPESKELTEMPPSLLLALPQLPKQVRYRFVGTNLLLVDRENNLIIDYMPRALP